MALTAGTRLGVYEIVGALGAGGMGEVYRARDTRLGRDVAVKILPEAFKADRERLARFEREARALAALNHPNIGAIYGLEEAPAGQAELAFPFIVMELVPGETLAERIASAAVVPRSRAQGSGLGGQPASRLAVPEALAIARQIIDALDAAHERGIVHRDLKPANIKVTPEGVAKVLDFGLAKAEVEAPDRDLSQSPTITSGGTRDGMILGTAAYMSPEQARGKAVDKRADIWAFGCVLFEILTGRVAFSGETVSDTIGAILHTEPDWNLLPGAVGGNVRRLLKHCLEKDLRRRLRDIGDARAELDAPELLPISASPEPAPLRRAHLPWSIAAVATLAGVAALGWAMRPSTVSTPPTLRLSPAIRVTNTPAGEFGPAISPDGKWVAFYSNSGGRTDLIVKFLDNGSTLNLTRSLNLELPMRTGIGGVAISPDGSQITFGARPDPTANAYDTWVIPGPIGGVPRKLLSTIPAVQWSPDGKQFAYTLAGSTRGDGLAVSSSDGTGEHILVERQGGRHIHWSAWSRDGKWIYFIYTYDTWHTEPSEIYRVSTAGGPQEAVVRSARRAVYPAPMPGGDLLFAGNPDTLELGLWWLRSGSSQPVSVTNGIGEHVEPRLSADGRRLVATLVAINQAVVALPAAGGAAAPQKLTDGFGGDLDPSVDRQSGRIVFSSARSGHRNLWVADADGSAATPLTTEAAIDEKPAFSPDGQQVAFVSDRGGERGIWIISAQGGAPKLLARETVLDTLTWSRDGQRIFFARPGGDLPLLASVGVTDGKVEPFMTPTPGAFAPAWSLRDDVLAYLEPRMIPAVSPSVAPVARMVLRFVDSQGRDLFPALPPQVNFSNGFLSWSPDGQRIAAASVPANGAAQIWIVEPRSPQPFRKLADLPATVRPRGLTWSKEGDHVLFASQEFAGDIVYYDIVR